MNNTSLQNKTVDLVGLQVEPFDPSGSRANPSIVPREVGLRCAKVADGGCALYAVLPGREGLSSSEDAISNSASQRSAPIGQLSVLINELVASADHLSQLSTRFPSMTPFDADRICAQAIRALLSKLERNPDTIVEAGTRKSSVRICVESYVQRNLASKSITPDLIYRQLEIPRSTLYKAFAETGGVARYIQDQRLDVAKSLLTHPEEHRSLSHIADSLGFKTTARFSKAFRRRFGCSPRQMRKIGPVSLTAHPQR